MKNKHIRRTGKRARKRVKKSVKKLAKSVARLMTKRSEIHFADFAFADAAMLSWSLNSL